MKLQCWSCGTETKTLRCSQCSLAHYCSEACQLRDRRHHESLCKKSPIDWLMKRGVPNVGNSCFMASSLQLLMAIPQIRSYFLSNRYSKDANAKSQHTLGHAFADFLKKMATGEDEYETLRIFYQQVGKCETTWVNKDQHDAQEFLSWFIDTIHEAVKQHTTLPRQTSPTNKSLEQRAHDFEANLKPSRIDQIFGGMYHNQIKCLHCGHKIDSFERLFSLSLPVPCSSTIPMKIWYFAYPPSSPPIVTTMQIPISSRYSDLLKLMSSRFHAPPANLVLASAYDPYLYDLRRLPGTTGIPVVKALANLVTKNPESPISSHIETTWCEHLDAVSEERLDFSYVDSLVVYEQNLPRVYAEVYDNSSTDGIPKAKPHALQGLHWIPPPIDRKTDTLVPALANIIALRFKTRGVSPILPCIPTESAAGLIFHTENTLRRWKPQLLVAQDHPIALPLLISVPRWATLAQIEKLAANILLDYKENKTDNPPRIETQCLTDCKNSSEEALDEVAVKEVDRRPYSVRKSPYLDDEDVIIYDLVELAKHLPISPAAKYVCASTTNSGEAEEVCLNEIIKIRKSAAAYPGRRARPRRPSFDSFKTAAEEFFDVEDHSPCYESPDEADEFESCRETIRTVFTTISGRNCYFCKLSAGCTGCFSHETSLRYASEGKTWSRDSVMIYEILSLYIARLFSKKFLDILATEWKPFEKIVGAHPFLPPNPSKLPPDVSRILNKFFELETFPSPGFVVEEGLSLKTSCVPKPFHDILNMTKLFEMTKIRHMNSIPTLVIESHIGIHNVTMGYIDSIMKPQRQLSPPASLTSLMYWAFEAETLRGSEAW